MATGFERAGSAGLAKLIRVAGVFRGVVETSAVAKFGGPAISIAVLGAAMFELHAMDWHAVAAMVPRNPLFWLVFACAYMTPIIADWLIYRRIWDMPVGGIVPMMRKMIGNELLVGYVGEAYLYTWARRDGRVSAAAFGAVKDVAILSAAVGNTATILVAIVALPFMARVHLDIPMWGIALSMGIVVVPPVVAMLLRHKLFLLPGRELMRIAGLHAMRATLTITLTALLWHLALPQVATIWWLVFSAVKLLLSRLPFVSNKELVFAGVTAALLGRGTDVAALMAMMASLQVATHVGLGLIVGGSDVAAGLARRFGHPGRPERASAI